MCVRVLFVCLGVWFVYAMVCMRGLCVVWFVCCVCLVLCVCVVCVVWCVCKFVWCLCGVGALYVCVVCVGVSYV